jgi:hypothetical protein
MAVPLPDVTWPDRADARAAIQAAAHIENWELAHEIAEAHGLTGLCLICVNAPPEVRLRRLDRATRVVTEYPFCMACHDAWVDATPDFDPDA